MQTPLEQYRLAFVGTMLVHCELREQVAIGGLGVLEEEEVGAVEEGERVVGVESCTLLDREVVTVVMVVVAVVDTQIEPFKTKPVRHPVAAERESALLSSKETSRWTHAIHRYQQRSSGWRSSARRLCSRSKRYRSSSSALRSTSWSRTRCCSHSSWRSRSAP